MWDQLPDTAWDDLYICFKNLFYQNQCKYAMNIGGTQIRGALLWFFLGKKCPFIFTGQGLEFLK